MVMIRYSRAKKTAKNTANGLTIRRARMKDFIELHLWNMDENKRNTPVLVNVGTIAQVMIDYKAPTIIYFGTYDHIRVSETYEEVKQLLATVEYVYKEDEE